MKHKLSRFRWIHYDWRIPMLLVFIQAVYIFQSFGYIRYEDLAESVRNPFWLQQRTIYDGTSSNVGWYGILLGMYEVFGFHLYTARYYHLFVYAVFIFTTNYLLHHYAPKQSPVIPLLTLGLSPTLLYFNTFQTAFGIESQYFIIIVLVLMSFSIRMRKNRILAFLAGFLTMWAAMTYPPGLFLFPAVGVIGYMRLRHLNLSNKQTINLGILAIGGFITPLLLMLVYLKDPSRLLHDQVGGQGIFRGSGRLSLDGRKFLDHTNDTFNDLFITGTTAQIELPQVEFGGIYPTVAVVGVLILAYRLAAQHYTYRPLIVVCFLLMATSLIGSGLSSWGLRTNVPLLIGFYGLFTGVWMFYIKQRNITWLVLIILSLIPMHHLLNLVPLYHFIGQPSRVSYSLDNNPVAPFKQLDSLLTAAQDHPIQLQCNNDQGVPISCRYQEIYAAIAGACYWNHLQCHPVMGFDVKSQQFIILKPSLWLSYYWAH